ncbi:VanZ family protein [Alkalimarinus alittae]|uniref:VanZ family protein n=1 Tax=Alkalimarinus alittae TaxID=2961619 RepID=A0ABY6N3G5_9ALTE|nr:VanZ family protein [Alkalimarinus alittae]UZE96570.1 VanZ family protein [Alkalimarinus alittae]
MIEPGQKPPSINIPLWMLVGCLVLAGPLLFIGGPDHYSARPVKLLWDLGHIPLMFCLGLILIKLLSILRLTSYWLFFSIYLCVILVVAVTTEFIQGKIGRIASISDVASDIWGALLAWLFIGHYPLVRRFAWRCVFTGVAIGLGAVVLSRPAMVLYDEVLARVQFPLLAGFESTSELSRWKVKSGLVRSTDRATEGRYSLKVLLLPTGYSGVSFRDFPVDWRAFDVLRFDVWSPMMSLPITVRVHDKTHQEGAQVYDDRFNRRYRLDKGWNRITIDLHEISQAPKGRTLKLSEVEGFGFFGYNLGFSETIYLDQVLLLRKDS